MRSIIIVFSLLVSPTCIAALIHSICRSIYADQSLTRLFSMSSPESLAKNGKAGIRVIAGTIALSSLLIPSSRFNI